MKTNPVKLSPQIQKIPSFFFGTELDENHSSKEFLLSVYNSVQTSIFIVDVLEDGDFCYFAMNPTHERWLGISSEQLQGKKPEDILSAADAIKVRQNYNKCVQLGTTISYQQCLQFQDINTYWSTTLTPLKNSQSQIYRLIGTSTKITSPKLLENTQLQREIKYLEEKIELQKQQYQLQLQQIQNFQNLVRKIREQIYEQVNIDQLLQTIVSELSLLLNLEECQLELYNHNQTIATVSYQYNPHFYSNQKITRKVSDLPEIYQLLLKKQPFQSVEILSENPIKINIICQLGYPIFDTQGVLGNIWLIKSTSEKFNDVEISLVQDIANECAIALRQSQLQKKTNAQLQEIENTERREYEFLRTLVQKFSTPVTNIHLATQTLENLITTSGIRDFKSLTQLVQILQNECERENKLINDLLTLTYLKIEPELPILISINVENILQSIVESFRDIAYLQQQKLSLNILTDIQKINTDITDFQQIVSTLINHACQCTPPGESIIISANYYQQILILIVTYSGVEIPDNELAKVFQPFYHFTKNEPWKNSSSGLELVLVQEMVRRLNGTIVVHSTNQEITFTVKLPITPVF
ncbi:MAG: PAS domain-containing protein [Sphaerospermopsis sp. SIO1G2]|nr:PAS domain-containing protein [Sphaerospermopsis sp. SIO1G1]NET72919.1 PAS domain-containing protein [Sphaerospermopsis sp. SIO1G2]